jgi:FkbM family methyltransferase
MVSVLGRKLRTIRSMIGWTGWKGAFVIKPVPRFLRKLLGIESKQISMPLRGYEHPVTMRYGSSDPAMFHQMFIFQEYACIADLCDVRTILDAGANVGFASLRLLKMFRDAHIVAVEPDSTNFDILKMNLGNYAERVSLVQSGIWSHPAPLKVINSGLEACAVEVRECELGETPDLESIDIESLMTQSHLTSIDLLKMDIEGSERLVFSRGVEKWLPKVRNLVIELHGDACQKALFSALAEYDYETLTYGELTVCKRIRRKNPQEEVLHAIG